MSNWEVAASIGIVALVTAFTRWAPHMLFGGKQELPPVVRYLSRVLPPAIMIVLVLYCIRSINVAAFPFGMNYILPILVTIAVHVWKRNTILSIALGTALHMILIRTIFPL